LHSGVLHNFRRLGNGLVLLQMLDAAVQVKSTSTLLHLPTIGSPQPLINAAAQMAGAYGERAEESDTVEMAKQVVSLCAPLASSASLLLRALVQAATAMSRVKDAWLAGDEPECDFGGADTTKAFHRVWSSVQFLFCTVPFESERGQIDNSMLFGDGVPMAGALFLHFLGQRHRFELFDFSQHVFSVFSASGVETQQVDQTLRGFVNRYMLLKAITERSFAMLDASDMPTAFNVWRYG